MVEEPIEPRRPQTPSPSSNGRAKRETVGHWLLNCFVGLLGLLAALGSFARWTDGATREAEPEEPHPPSGLPRHDGEPKHVTVVFERTDVRFRPILFFMLGMACFAALHFWIIWWFFNDYNRYESSIKQSPYPLAPAPSANLPAEPRLEQIDRVEGIRKPDVFLRQQSREQTLDTLEPASEAGFSHIPIERAMQLVVKDLPAQAQAPAPNSPGKNNGLLDGGEPNSGRLFRGKAR